MTGGGSSELKSLRSQVERALEVCGNVGADLTGLEEKVSMLQAIVADLQIEVGELQGEVARAKAKPKRAPRSKAQPRAKAR